MQWFRQAKFGLFIHWGLYCIPAGEWKGQPIAGIGEWIMNRAKIPVTEYEQLAKQFNPVKFNAEEWVQMAEDAGMKYIVITSKHHDGFAMYGSEVSKYNIVDATPFHRDPLKELSAACARHNIKFGFYYSQSQDWHEPAGMGNTWDFGPDAQKDSIYDSYLRGKAEPQVKELLTGYGPVALIWFDTARMMTGDRGPRFIDIMHTLQPAALIDGRLGVKGDYRSTGDNQIPNEVLKEDWEVPATLNHTWGFKKDDTDWKTTDDLTFKLVDIVSKGGNYLLNVGPTSEGVIPQASQDNLRGVGKWLKVNGESIYGAGPTPFGRGTRRSRQHHQRQKGQPRLQDRQRLALHHQARQALHPPLQIPGRNFRALQSGKQSEESVPPRRRQTLFPETEADRRQAKRDPARQGPRRHRFRPGPRNRQLKWWWAVLLRGSPGPASRQRKCRVEPHSTPAASPYSAITNTLSPPTTRAFRLCVTCTSALPSGRTPLSVNA